MAYGPFLPHGATITVSASTTSANAALTSPTAQRVYNSTTAIAFVKFSATASPVATSADIPIPAGGVEVFDNASGYVGVILASGTGSVYFTSGNGL